MQPVRNIHVNPKFKLAHINPNFLTKPKFEVPTRAPNIFVNPNFIPPKLNSSATISNKLSNVNLNVQTSPILKTRRKIIRETVKKVNKPVAFNSNIQLHSRKTDMVKIGVNKLIRIHKRPQIMKPISKYKFIRNAKENSFTKIIDSRNSIIKKYFLCRTELNDNPTPKKVIIEDKKLMRIGSSNLKYRNKSLEFLNINGVLYKSTSNKLEKSIPKMNPLPKPLSSTLTPSNASKSVVKHPVSHAKSGRFLFVSGEKFILEANGKSLKRLNNERTEFKRKRIDIGGLTYVAKSDSTYEQTKYHKSRSHLNTAKSKSISVLRKKYAKVNTPCPIYRRLGKCLAMERGRCPNVHDKNNVMICPNYLKEECSNEKCLLSHDVNLSKMPVCKFFLQGCCFKNDCPYLHKKINENVEICEEFANGFCLLAEKCSKRHELKPMQSKSLNNKSLINKKPKNCPWLDKHGRCLESNCKFTHNIKVIKKTKALDATQDEQLESASTNNRYFLLKDNVKIDEENEQEDENAQVINVNFRKPISEDLPSYLPLSA